MGIVNRRPLISVLLPVYNAARTVAETIQSVLSQTETDWELLLLNDGSTDDSLEVIQRIRDPRIRVIDEKTNRGLVASLNRGLDEARGEFVARIDADDLCRPRRFAVQVKAMQQSGAVLSASNLRLIDASGKSCGRNRWRFAPADIYFQLRFRNCIAHPSVMILRSAMRDLRYDGRALHIEDFALWNRLSEVGPVIHLTEPLVSYRVHAGSVSSVHAELQAANARRWATERLSEVLKVDASDFHQAVVSPADIVRAGRWSKRSQVEWEEMLESLVRLRPSFITEDEGLRILRFERQKFCYWGKVAEGRIPLGVGTGAYAWTRFKARKYINRLFWHEYFP